MLEKFKNPKLLLVVAGLGLYFLSVGASYAFFSRRGQGLDFVSPVSPVPASVVSRVPLDMPKTEVCPLNGEKFTLIEKQVWEKRRPLTVMIENHQEARPQSGLSKADIIYEAVAEGGITRLLAVFYCRAAVGGLIIGPVRSARTYFMDFASEYGDFPLYAHVGGANTPGPANALGQLESYGWVAKGNDLNQFSVGFPVFWRDYERIGHSVATEHTMYADIQKIWEVANERKLTNVDQENKPWNKNFIAWQFKNDEPVANVDNSVSPQLSFWKGHSDYDIGWEYQSTSNTYRRVNGGKAHKDLNNDEQLEAKNVIAVFMKESRANDGYMNNLHLLYATKGSGQAIIFQDGRAIKGTWNKENRQSRMIFKDNRDREIELNRGPIWIEILPTGASVDY